MPGKCAIDIVLLPPEKILQEAVRLNRRLLKKGPQPIFLNHIDTFPHLSLVMGVVTEAMFSGLVDAVKKIIRTPAPFSIHLNEIKTTQPDSNTDDHITVWCAERSPALQNLHESLMNNTGDIVTHDATLDAFLSPPPVTETVLKWVNRYHTDYSYDRFDPHITLGKGTPAGRDKPKPQSFAGEKIAICHLGTYCTCRKILWSGSIGEIDI